MHTTVLTKADGSEVGRMHHNGDFSGEVILQALYQEVDAVSAEWLIPGEVIQAIKRAAVQEAAELWRRGMELGLPEPAAFRNELAKREDG